MTWRAGGTPFDRTPDARPLLRLAVDVAAGSTADAPGTERVLALAELPFLEVRTLDGIQTFDRGGPSAASTDLIVGAPAAADAAGVGARGAVRPSEALDLVRVFLVHLGVFVLRGGGRVDASFYHLYRYKSVFRAYQPAWSAAVTGGAIPGGVADQLESLGTRLDLACRAVDRGAYHALRRADNDSQDEVLYHLGYFVMLATGVFDDLAWTLTHLYGLSSLGRQHATLKLPAHRAGARPPPAWPLVDALRASRAVGAPVAAARVADPAVQALVGVFYPIRDRLQHRHYLQGKLFVGGPWGVPKILFEFPPESAALLVAAASDGTGAEWGLHAQYGTWVDPYAFLTRGLRALATVHDAVVGAVDWPALVGASGTAARDDLDASLARYAASLAAFLGWPREPLYF